MMATILGNIFFCSYTRSYFILLVISSTCGIRMDPTNRFFRVFFLVERFFHYVLYGHKELYRWQVDTYYMHYHCYHRVYLCMLFFRNCLHSSLICSHRAIRRHFHAVSFESANIGGFVFSYLYDL